MQHRFIGKRYDGGISPLAATGPLFRGTLAEALLHGKPGDKMVFPGDEARMLFDLDDVRNIFVKAGHTPEKFAAMPPHKQDRIVRDVWRNVRHSIRQSHPEVWEQHYSARAKEQRRLRAELEENFRAMREQRNALHDDLEANWRLGPLRLERPSSSWAHHLGEWDRAMCAAEPSDSTKSKLYQDLDSGQLQCVLVENDWGAVVPPGEGEWHLPFPDTLWEMHVSGVRVMAICTEEEQHPGEVTMIMVYGKNGVWVADNHSWRMSAGTLIAKQDNVKLMSSTLAPPFRRVAELCRDVIRSSCVMLDAQVAERVRVEAPTHGRVDRTPVPVRRPLRDHYVVRLLRQRTVPQHRVARSAGGTLYMRAPQRGHWRQGAWVHYDDPDSGKVQYANDGGFFVSKTWRRWHFAGDPNNIIHKEYRL